jgi:hypothetical protein
MSAISDEFSLAIGLRHDGMVVIRSLKSELTKDEALFVAAGLIEIAGIGMDEATVQETLSEARMQLRQAKTASFGGRSVS